MRPQLPRSGRDLLSPARPLLVALAVVLTASAPLSASGQSLSGTEGLLLTPTARMHPDGSLVLGAGYVPEDYSGYQDEGHAYTPLYATLTFLPSVEVGFRFSRAVDSGTPEALGDRMFLVRVRALREGRVVPAVAFGAHDFLRSSGEQTNFFNALYVVASKRVGLGVGDVLNALDLHLGYGTDAVEGAGHQFVGVFGGADLTVLQRPSGPVARLALLGEYDGQTVALGTRLHTAFGIALTAGLQGFQAPVVGVSARTSL